MKTIFSKCSGKKKDMFGVNTLCPGVGKGADIKYIKPGDNHGAGLQVGNKVEKSPDGAK